MASSRDYVPSKDANFDAWFHNLVEYVKQKTDKDNPVWDHIPPAAVTKLSDASDDWHVHYEATRVPHTPAATTAKNDARKRNEKVARDFVQRYLRWDPVTNEDLKNLGIPLRDEIPTSHNEVNEKITVIVETHDKRELRVGFWVTSSTSKAKPDGYNGAVIAWAILDSPPISSKELINHELSSRTPYTLTFDESQRGNMVYIAARWENGRGIKGPWSDIHGTIIP
ncbi:MAG: hypothetical protein FWG13_07285 [Leptospirales bacterium]|nr:hypothetical protein [Leptospirales bacterium]